MIGMTKIENMYRWSGGTDYRHICYECPNLKKTKVGKRQVYKCMAYGITDSPETTWKESNIACRFFGKTHKGKPVMELYTEKRQETDNIPGQMTIEDFLES